MKLLVLADRSVDAAAVRAALPGEALDGTEVLVVTPAVNDSKLAFWVSDSDEAIADAEDVGEASVQELSGEGAASVSGEVGESEPLLALQDALATFKADRILVLMDDADVAGEAQQRFSDVPVSRG